MMIAQVDTSGLIYELCHHWYQVQPGNSKEKGACNEKMHENAAKSKVNNVSPGGWLNDLQKISILILGFSISTLSLMYETTMTTEGVNHCN